MSLELGPCLLEDVVEATVVDKGQEGETPTIEGGAMYFDVPLVGKRRTRRVLVAVNGVLSLGSRARLLLVRAKEAGSSNELYFWLPRGSLPDVLTTLRSGRAVGAGASASNGGRTPPSAGPRFLQNWMEGQHLRRDEWSRALSWLLRHLVVFDSGTAGERSGGG